MREIADTLHTILPKQPCYMASEHAHGLLRAATNAAIGYGCVPLGARMTAQARNDALVRASEVLAAYIAQLEARIVEGGR